MKNKEWWDNVLYYIILGVCRFLAFFPFCFLYILSDILFLVVYYLIGYRRSVVRDNLCQSFPKKTKKEILGIEKKFYHFFCDYIVETIKVASISSTNIQKHMRFMEVEKMEKVLLEDGYDFIFLYLGHYCNWEWVASLPYSLSSQIHCAQIYHPLYNKAMDRFFLRLRNQYGGECVPMKNTLRRVMQLRQEKRPTIIGFISDQLPKVESMHLFVPFLNHPETAVFTGGEQMGKRMKVAYYFADIKRPRRGYYEVNFIRMYNDELAESAEYPMTILFMRMLEQMIVRAPQYWLWTHKRWKRTKEDWLKWNKQRQTKS